jgi:glycosyltransferase involved in cell wall biosynthesis
MIMSQLPILSIVIGAQNAYSTIIPCLQSLLEQVGDQAIEILVVDGSTDDTAEIVASQFTSVNLIRNQTQLLVPHLWGIGIQQAKAPIVAITTAHCIPSKRWISSILEITNRKQTSAGWGGAILPPNQLSPRDWAVYFTRYSAFMPAIAEGSTTEIAGDNAVYCKLALDKYWKNSANGFWETLFHHELRQNGESLYLSPNIEVKLGSKNHSWYFCQSRFRHGYHYGSTRPKTSELNKLMRIISAPILMPFLVLRIGLRIAKKHPDWIFIYVLALPWLVTFLSAWSLGEFNGYIFHSQTDRKLSDSTQQ